MEEVIFLDLLVKFVCEQILNLAKNYTKKQLIGKIQEISANPQKYGLESLSSEQNSLVNDLISTQYSFWQKPLRLIPRQMLSKRPIVIIGPSGVGKSMIAQRLSGKKPNRSYLASVKLEYERINVASWPPGVKILTAPGAWQHDTKGISEVVKSIISENSPKILCIVTCYGYHTTGGIYEGTYQRPDQVNTESAGVQEEFIEKCLDEEIKYLQKFMQQIREKLSRNRKNEISKRISSILLIINKTDLWEANHERNEVLARYTSPQSEFVAVIDQLRKELGLGSPSSYKVFPHYTFGGGFHPNPSVKAQALTTSFAEASSLVLRALIYNTYRRG